MKLEVFLVKKEDLAILMLDEAGKEGWFYSQEDVDFYFNYERNQISAITVDGELAGCVIMHSSLNQVNAKNLCSAGLFLVTNKFRGKKQVGPWLWEQAFSAKTKDAFICFHSVPRVVSFYERLGFQKTPLVNIFYLLELDKLKHQYDHSSVSLIQQGVVKIVDADDIKAYMNHVFPGACGAGIREFIQLWLRRPDAIVIAYYDSAGVKGFGVLTVCKKNVHNEVTSLDYRLSPLYADSAEIAGILLNYSIRCIRGKNNAKSIQLNFLDNPESAFACQLNEIGFNALGKNYVVSNYPDSIDKNTPVLKKIFASIPLEYPHEVVSGLS